MTSTPPQPWIWGSMKPGATMNSEASIRIVCAGMSMSRGDPAAAIEAPEMRSRPGENFSEGVNNVPASIDRIVGSLTTASQMTKDLAEIAVGFRQLFFPIFAAATKHAHDEGEFEVRTGCFDQAERFRLFDAKNFLQHVPAA